MKPTLLAVALIFFAAAPALADSAPASNAGAPAKGVRVVVPDHNIARGDVIRKSDLVYQTVPTGRAFGGVITAMSQLEGKQARRLLRLGEPVRPGDVRAPVLVARGSTVTMTFDAPGIRLTAVGKAMSEGGMGESVTVLNPVSYRQITATVTGPGTVEAIGPSATIHSAGMPARLSAAQP